MSTTLPTAPTKTNCDATSDDPKLALTVDLADSIDTIGDLIAALGGLAQMAVGNGLTTETMGAGVADKLHANIATTAKTGAYTVLAADRGKLIDCTSGTFSLTFTAAATLGDGWFCYVRNSGTGTVTLDPNASELVDGQSTLIVPPGMCGLVQCTGSAFKTSLVSITLLTALTAPAVADEMAIFDASDGVTKKITLTNLFKVIDALTAETAPAIGDELVLYDASAGTADKITLENLLKVIDSLTEDTSPALTTDFVLTYDTSASGVKKVKPSNLFSGVSTDAGAEGVGVRTLCSNQSGSAVTSGSTVAGTSLRIGYWTSLTADITLVGVALSGTWRNVSGINLANDELGDFQRIA